MTENKIIIALLSLLAIIAIGTVLSALQSVLLPFVIAFFLSYVFKPVVLALRKRKVPMAVAVVVVLLLVLAIISGVSVVIGASAKSFIAALPRYQGKLESLLLGTVTSIEQTGRSLGLIKQEFRMEDVISLRSLTPVLTSSIGSFVSFFSNAFLVLLFMIFILAGSGQLIAKLDSVSNDAQSNRISRVLASIDRQVRQYMLTKTLISLCSGMLSTIALSILGVDFALLWGFLIFLLNYVPNLGSLLATAFPVLVALVQFDSFTVPVVVLISLIVIQNVMGNVVEPKLMAFSLNLSPLLILASLLFWGWIWGIWGMILSVPIMAILKIVFENVDALRPVAVLMSSGPPKKV
jgi:AI-2 transport protein TqsA